MSEYDCRRVGAHRVGPIAEQLRAEVDGWEMWTGKRVASLVVAPDVLATLLAEADALGSRALFHGILVEADNSLPVGAVMPQGNARKPTVSEQA